ncbi:hypothetical protein L9F63_025031, partial [Diploptera punctata]
HTNSADKFYSEFWLLTYFCRLIWNFDNCILQGNYGNPRSSTRSMAHCPTQPHTEKFHRRINHKRYERLYYYFCYFLCVAQPPPFISEMYLLDGLTCRIMNPIRTPYRRTPPLYLPLRSSPMKILQIMKTKEEDYMLN